MKAEEMLETQLRKVVNHLHEIIIAIEVLLPIIESIGTPTRFKGSYSQNYDRTPVREINKERKLKNDKERRLQ